MLNAISEAWEEDPDDRPSMGAVRDILESQVAEGSRGGSETVNRTLVCTVTHVVFYGDRSETLEFSISQFLNSSIPQFLNSSIPQFLNDLLLLTSSSL